MAGGGAHRGHIGDIRSGVPSQNVIQDVKGVFGPIISGNDWCSRYMSVANQSSTCNSELDQTGSGMPNKNTVRKIRRRAGCRHFHVPRQHNRCLRVLTKTGKRLHLREKRTRTIPIAMFLLLQLKDALHGKPLLS